MTRYNRGEGSATGGGIGFVGALTLLFIGLRLTGHIDWPWVWVLSPLWLGTLIGIVVIGVLIVIAELLRRRDSR